MAISKKLLRLENTGLDGKTAFVGLDNDSPAGFRIAVITGIPARFNVTYAKQWVWDRYTNQQLWDIGVDVNGRERQLWLLLWKNNDVFAEIVADLAELETDIANVGSATLGQLQQIVKRTMQHQKRILNDIEKVTKAEERIIRAMAPIGEESLGE